ncbi:COX15/CtaA family protein [Aquirufa ecclesiirivi]|uniref:COX15/CtaA family protein n=1 Tax=Aquirufa ecclesiirivi TaxID=2715124 RepID=UPI0022A89ADD|nr:COX15/CtaA family protein [Aquirufa ecclesiirivi]MCZ2471863.1 heme A synthase [Aquirufa ecclesiirivi]
MTFQKFGFVTLLCIYLLILAGGIVRSTGSGMGCPDWPKCFGRFIPPTKESELPLHYEITYKEKLHGEVLFNPTKTWIEYINRLIGALTGLFVLITTILAFKSGKKEFILSFLALLLVLGNAVLGKYVVDSFLLPGVVTLHMLLSIGVLFLLFKALHVKQITIEIPTSIRTIVLINLLIILVQIVLGTQVREEMDHVIVQYGESEKSTWVSHLGNIYIIHRTFSWVVLISHLILWNKINKAKINTLKNYSTYLLVFLSISLITGILMAYVNLPLGSQAIHLTISLVILGLHMNTWIKTSTNAKHVNR